MATQPDQIYCWDITCLPARVTSPVRGMHFYLDRFVDIFSRKIVSWQVFERESWCLTEAAMCGAPRAFADNVSEGKTLKDILNP